MLGLALPRRRRQHLQVGRARQQLPKLALQPPQCPYRHLSCPLNCKIRLHPRNQFLHRHADPLSSRPTAIICLKEAEHVALRLGDRQPAVTCVPAKGDGADACDIVDEAAEDVTDTQESAHLTRHDRLG